MAFFFVLDVSCIIKLSHMVCFKCWSIRFELYLNIKGDIIPYSERKEGVIKTVYIYICILIRSCSLRSVQLASLMCCRPSHTSLEYKSRGLVDFEGVLAALLSSFCCGVRISSDLCCFTYSCNSMWAEAVKVSLVNWIVPQSYVAIAGCLPCVKTEQ